MDSIITFKDQGYGDLNDFDGQRIEIVRDTESGEFEYTDLVKVVRFPNGTILPLRTDEIVAHDREFDFDAFVDGYIEALLWADGVPHFEGGEPPADWNGETGGLEHLNVPDDVRAEVIERADLRGFVDFNMRDLLAYCEERSYDPSQGSVESYAGHDCYLTCAGHGTGFWDRGLGALGDRLTDACKGYSVDDHMLYDDGNGNATL